MSSSDKPLDMFWFIPVSGDGTYLGTDKGNRSADFSYLKQIAQAVVGRLDGVPRIVNEIEVTSAACLRWRSFLPATGRVLLGLSYYPATAGIRGRQADEPAAYL